MRTQRDCVCGKSSKTIMCFVNVILPQLLLSILYQCLHFYWPESGTWYVPNSCLSKQLANCLCGIMCTRGFGRYKVYQDEEL